MDYHLKSGIIEMGLTNAIFTDTTRNYPEVNLYFDGEFGKFSDFSFMLTGLGKTYFPNNEKIKIDLLIIQGKKKLDIKRLMKSVAFSELIIDGSVPYWKRDKIIEAMEGQVIPLYDLSKSGAYIKDF